MNTLQNSISVDTQYKSLDVSTKKAVVHQSPTPATKVETSAPATTATESAAKINSVSAQQAALNAAVASSTAKQQASSTTASQGASSSEKDNQKALEILNNKLAKLNNYMQFKKDDSSGLDVIVLVDSHSHKVIKQYPSEDFLNVARRLTEYLDRVNSSKPLNSMLDSSGVSNAIGNIISDSA